MPNDIPPRTAATPAGPAIPGSGAAESATQARPAPFLTVVRGRPTAAEVAALVSVLTARAAAGAALAGQPGPAGASRSAWSDRSRLLRQSISPGPGAWRRSSLPR